jgi:cell division septal protein FtsQ
MKQRNEPGRGGVRAPRRKNALELLQAAGRFARRNVRWILGVAAVLVLVAGVFVTLRLVRHLTLTVTALAVEGESPYGAEELLAASGVELGQRVATLNESAVEKRMREQFEYLDGVAVRVDKKGGVTLAVQQVEACFRIFVSGKHFALTESLTVLEMADEPNGLYDTTLVELWLPNVRRVLVGKSVEYGDELDRTAVREVFSLLAGEGFGRISELDLSNRYRIRLLLDGRFDVTLGDWNDLPRKMAVLEQILRDPRYAQAARVQVDLSDPDRTWARITEEGSEAESSAETAAEASH